MARNWRKLALLGLVAGAFAGGACKEKKPPADDREDGVVADAGADTDAGTGSTSTGAQPAAIPELAHVPGDADILLGVEVSRLTASKLWKEHSGSLGDATTRLALFERECGVNPLKVIERVVVATNSETGESTAVVGGLKRKTLTDCATRLRGRGGFELREENDTTVAVTGERELTLLWLGEDRFALGLGEPPATAETMRKRVAEGAGIGAGHSLYPLLGQLTDARTIWFVARRRAATAEAAPTAGAMSAFAALSNPNAGLYVTMVVGNDVKVRGGVAAASEIDAESAAGGLRILARRLGEGEHPLAGALKRLQIAQKADHVELSLTVSADEIATLFPHSDSSADSADGGPR